MNRSGIVVLAALFLGLFALLAGLIGGSIYGAHETVKAITASG